MYFTINTAFANYLYAFPNLTVSFPLIRDRTTYEQTLPLNLSIIGFDKSLLHASTNLKDFIKSYAKDKENFLLGNSISFNRINFLLGTQAFTIPLTWLLLVYGKIVYLPRHPP